MKVGGGWTTGVLRCSELFTSLQVTVSLCLASGGRCRAAWLQTVSIGRVPLGRTAAHDVLLGKLPLFAKAMGERQP